MNVTGRKVTYVQVEAGESNKNLTAKMQKELKKSVGLIDDYSYFGPTGKEDLEWTLAQMKEKPNSWEWFVRENGPWFEK